MYTLKLNDFNIYKQRLKENIPKDKSLNDIKTDQDVKNAGVTGNDHQEVNAGTTFAYGPVTVGFQKMGEFTGSQTAGETEYYDNEAFGVSFNVNDNLSISYGEFESKRHKVGSGASDKTVTGETQSFQIAYTMGGMSLKLAESEVTNASYSTAASNDHDGRTIALSLAF